MPVDFVVAKTGVPVKNGGVTVNTGKKNQSGVTTSIKREIFDISGTWVCPANVTKIKVECIGRGGLGAGTVFANLPNFGTGGGGGGAYASSRLDVVPGTSYTVNIGVGAVGTYFNTPTTVYADNGTAGTGSSPAGAAGGLAANSIGEIVIAGDAGGTGTSLISGAGGAPGNHVGIGGAGRNSTGTGIAGTVGGGGGGTYRTSNGSNSGGASGAGRVIITYEVIDPVVGSISAIESKYTDRFDDAGYYI